MYIDALFIVFEKNNGIIADAPAAISDASSFFDKNFENKYTTMIVLTANMFGNIFSTIISGNINENSVSM